MQVGQRRDFRELYGVYHSALTGDQPELFPPSTPDEVRAVLTGPTDATNQAHVVCDVICGMTEAQAVRVHQRMAGIEFGPLLDPQSCGSNSESATPHRDARLSPD